jgi:hypothetical protein
MPRQNLLTWQPATRHQLVTWRVHGTLANGATRGPQLARTYPFLFLLLPPNFFPAYPSSGLPTPPASSLSPAPPFSPPPTQLSHNSPVLFHSSQSSAARSLSLFTLICAPPSIGRPSLALAQLSPVSPAPANTHPPGNCLRPASSSSSTTGSLSSLAVSLHLRYAFKSFYWMNSKFILILFVTLGCYICLVSEKFRLRINWRRWFELRNLGVVGLWLIFQSVRIFLSLGSSLINVFRLITIISL